MELVIAEKPSVAQSIAAVLGATQRKDGYLEGNDYLVAFCTFKKFLKKFQKIFGVFEKRRIAPRKYKIVQHNITYRILTF